MTQFDGIGLHRDDGLGFLLGILDAPSEGIGESETVLRSVQVDAVGFPLAAHGFHHRVRDVVRVDLEIPVEQGAHGTAAPANGVVDTEDGFIRSGLDRERAGVFALAAADHRQAGIQERVERQRREDREPDRAILRHIEDILAEAALERCNGVVDDLLDGRALRGAQLIEDALGDVSGTREGPVVLGGLVLPPVILALAAPMADAWEVIFLPVARRVDDVALGIQAVDGQYERGLEGEPAEIDVVGEPELIGQVVAEAIAVDVEFAPEAPRAEPRFDCLCELIGDILAIRKSRLIEPVVEPVREHAGDGMRQVAGGQSLVRLDLIRVDEAIGPRKRGVREQFAADARGMVVLPVFGPVVEVDIPSVPDGLQDFLPVETVADDIREHGGGLIDPEQFHDVIVAVDLEVIGKGRAVVRVEIGHVGTSKKTVVPIDATRRELARKRPFPNGKGRPSITAPRISFCKRPVSSERT